MQDYKEQMKEAKAKEEKEWAREKTRLEIEAIKAKKREKLMVEEQELKQIREYNRVLAAMEMDSEEEEEDFDDSDSD